VNILPTLGAADHGSVQYLAGLGLGLGVLDLQAAILGVPTLAFTVEPGHSQDLTFTFDALLGVEALGDYRIVVQKWDDVNGTWTTIDGLQEGASILEISVLDADTYGVEQRLDSGQYRAFVTFEGVGLSLFNELAIAGTDYDYTDIAGYEAVPVSGNVMGNDPVTTDDTVVQSVNGVMVTGPGTEIEGQYGTLSIDPDGNFTYTPFETDGNGIGQVDTFVYTLVETVTSATTTSTLYVQIGSDGVAMSWDPEDPGAPATAALVASDDSAAVEVAWDNVAIDDYFADRDAELAALASQYVSDTFEITGNMEVSGVVTISALAAVGGNGTIYVERQTGPNSWEVVAQETFNSLLQLGEMGSLDLSEVEFAEGTYRIRVTKGGIGLALSISTEVDIIYVDQFEIDSIGGHKGNLLDNDDLGSSFTKLEIFDGDTFITVTSAGPVTVEGTYGSLAVDADGNWVYTPDHTSGAQTDIFTYQLVHPTGETVQGSLTLVVEPSGAGVDAMAESFSLLLEEPGLTIDLDDERSAGDGGGPQGNPSEDSADTGDYSDFGMFQPDPLFGPDALGKIDEQPI